MARDFRQKFQISYNDIGIGVRYDEAALLVMSLLQDTESWLHAALSNWDYPVSREWLLFADLYDLQAASKSKRKPKPYPRPFSSSKTYGGRRKNGIVRSKEEVLRILRPNKNLPNKG